MKLTNIRGLLRDWVENTSNNGMGNLASIQRNKLHQE
jgi:hypothetical protein